MGMSQGNFSLAPQGTQLKAWALVKGDGTIIKSGGISGLTKPNSTYFKPVFSVAMAGTNYIVRGFTQGTENGVVAMLVNKTTADCWVSFVGMTVAPDMAYFEIFE